MRFVIFAQMRTGGTLLVKLLQSHPGIQFEPHEVSKQQARSWDRLREKG